MNKIKKVLIANRGEIALRIQRSCHEMGFKSVQAVSEVDVDMPAAKSADEVIIIGPGPAQESYLNVANVIRAAKDSDSEAIHPGYGFLSENADFAEAVEKSGLIFVGPTPEQIRKLGGKTGARSIAQAEKIPLCKGTDGGLTDKEILVQAKKIGFPLMIKAVGGGGGRGMRIARTDQELNEHLPRARSEAIKFFANEDVYVEQFVDAPRHIEVQLVGDGQGNVVHFGTRECSVQRRHQKLVEEAPAPRLSKGLREKIEQAALRLAQAVNYRSAATAEFLVEGEKFYFLEVNTRIQVEHPVTEMVCDVDLVSLQFKVAQGEKLSVKQKDIRLKGHAIEFRVNAEDSSKNFSPVSGEITKISSESDESFREERGYAAGNSIPRFYDSLVSKVVVRGADRAHAIAAARNILHAYRVEGVPTTVPFHRWLLQQKEFVNSTIDVRWVDRVFGEKEALIGEALSLKDLHHKCGTVDKENYRSLKFKTDYSIEVIHRKDGLFLAVPIGASGSSKGKRPKNPERTRISNGKQAAVQALCDDVLEVFPPNEVFK